MTANKGMDLVRPTILSELRRRTRSRRSTVDDLRQVVQAMQRTGLSQGDIEVHLERIRAVNDVRSRSETIENNCLLALDIVSGHAGDWSLMWDHAELSSIYVPRVVTDDLLSGNVRQALEANDLLPPRPVDSIDEPLLHSTAATVAGRLRSEEWRPSLVEIFRVPRGTFTTRPGALLAPADRVIYEALAGRLESEVDRVLSRAVIWPRSRTIAARAQAFQNAPIEWDCEYIIKADISAYYESVDHSILGMILAARMNARSDEVLALEHFLGAIMGAPVGLPIGPTASDVFASAYLSLVDSDLENRDWEFARFADDFLLAANSMSDAREKIEILERHLGEHHLRLNDAKTLVMRKATYLDGLSSIPKALVSLKRQLRTRREEALLETDDRDEVADALTAYGADEQMLFDVLYHRTMSVEEAIAELGERLDPDVETIYLEYLRSISAELSSGSIRDDMAPVERLTRQCVAYLAATRQPEALTLIESVIPWFPTLSPYAAVYFAHLPEAYSELVDATLMRLLVPRHLPDWSAAWLCWSIQQRRTSIGERLLRHIGQVARTTEFGPLATMCALWTLEARAELPGPEWESILRAASPAMRAELLLGNPNPHRDPMLALPPMIPEG